MKLSLKFKRVISSGNRYNEINEGTWINGYATPSRPRVLLFLLLSERVRTVIIKILISRAISGGVSPLVHPGIFIRLYLHSHFTFYILPPRLEADRSRIAARSRVPQKNRASLILRLLTGESHRSRCEYNRSSYLS